MKGIICYYSGTGNTKLACNYLAGKISAAEWTLHDIVKQGMPDLEQYSVAGFATFTDFWSIPQKFKTFLENLPEKKGQLSFILNTYGMITAFTLRDMARLLRLKKYRLIDGFSLHTPENYPPMIAAGMAMENAPDDKELENFKVFVQRLNQSLEGLKRGEVINHTFRGINPLLFWVPTLSRKSSGKSMKEKYVDVSLCTQCRICEKGCPYAAIKLDPYPIFDEKKCYGCWSCFNHCPQQAIYTGKFRGDYHYPRPLPQLREKLKP